MQVMDVSYVFGQRIRMRGGLWEKAEDKPLGGCCVLRVLCLGLHCHGRRVTPADFPGMWSILLSFETGHCGRFGF